MKMFAKKNLWPVCCVVSKTDEYRTAEEKEKGFCVRAIANIITI